MRMALTGSRQEFLAADTLGTAGDIQYGRTGGCFVSTKAGVASLLFWLASLILVGLLVFYLAPCPNGGAATVESAALDATTEAATGDAGQAWPEGSGAPPSTEVSPSKTTITDLRLPDAVRPRYYSIWLQPFIGDPSVNNFTYKGVVDIEVTCVTQGDVCSRISLHAKELNITWDEVTLRMLPQEVRTGSSNATVANTTNTAANTTTTNSNSANATASNATVATTTAPPTSHIINITGHSKYIEKDIITFTLEKPLEVGRNYSLKIPFWGNVTTRLSGFYRSSFTEKDGTKKWLAVTHFEPTDARRAFPCFDEPAMKARFEVHVARRAAMSSISNMPLNRTDDIPDQPGWVWDHYPASPVMSSYLVALVVSELDRKSAPASATAPGSPAFDVAARPDLLPSADYALQIGPRIIDHYTDYFNVSYPLPKLTMAAIPDFAAGAMENWGLVLYRETLMLYNPNSSTVDSQQSVASVVAHELAHQWFGNLVTMAWWSDLWLNEGFATYVAYIGVNHVEPTWNILDKIVTEEMHPVLETDSLNSSHPVSVQVQNPAQISEVFDEVSYNKGACLIRMLNHSLTEPVFRRGLTNYLNKWKWSNAVQDDLWVALTEAAAEGPQGLLPQGTSVKNVMDTWTLQKGYPVVVVKRDYTSGSALLSQRQFKLDGTNSTNAWFVPVSYATGEDVTRLQETRPRAWLTPQRSDLTITNITAPGSNTWLLLNIQQTGYYRVNYDSANWRLLTQLLRTAPLESVPAASRAQLLSDALNLARGGLLNYDSALNLTLYLARERDPTPWFAFMRAYSFLNDLLRDSREYSNLQAYLRRLLSPLAESLGLQLRSTDTQPQRQLRAAALARLLLAEEPRMVDWALAQYAVWLNASSADNPVPVDMRFQVYCAAARYGGVREWAALDARFQASDQQPNERSNLLRALMCTRLPHLITTMLERSLEEGGGIRLQDSIYVWRSATTNPVASYIAFRYVRERWDSIYEKYSKVPFVLKEVLRSSIGGLNTEMDLQEVTKFLKEREGQLTMATLTVQQALEKLRLRVHWGSRYRSQLTAWLAQEAVADAAATTTATSTSTAANISTSPPTPRIS